MAKVNVPPMKVPASVAEGLTREAFEYLDELTFTVYQLFLRTGGGNDDIEEITDSDSYETSLSSGQGNEQFDENTMLEDLIPVVIPEIFKAMPISGNYTAVHLDNVDASGNAKIKLSPSQGAQIITANGDGSTINVDGDGIELRCKGKTGSDINIRNKGTSLHWYLFESPTDKYWRAS